MAKPTPLTAAQEGGVITHHHGSLTVCAIPLVQAPHPRRNYAYCCHVINSHTGQHVGHCYTNDVGTGHWDGIVDVATTFHKVVPVH